MSTEKVSMFINNKRVVEFDYKNTLLMCLFSFEKNIKFMSKECIIENILEGCNLVEETFEWNRDKRKNVSFKKRINIIRENIKKLEYKTRNDIMVFYYNILMSIEGLNVFTKARFLR